MKKKTMGMSVCLSIGPPRVAEFLCRRQTI